MNGTDTRSYTTSTANNLLIGSGCLYKNYGLETESKIGATSGGNEWQVKPTFRSVKVDGILSDHIKGLTHKEKEEVTLKVNLLEFTKDTFQLALNGVIDSDSNADYYIVKGKSDIDDSDYIQNLALVGRISGSSTPVIIVLYNALSTDGVQVKTEDSKDNQLSVTFTAFTDPNAPDVLPYEVRLPKGTGNQFFVSETPIVDNSKVLLTFSDMVETVPPKDGFAVTVNGSADVVTASIRGVNKTNTILLTLTTAPTSGQAVTVAYTKPTDVAKQVTSMLGVALNSFTTLSVTNN